MATAYASSPSIQRCFLILALMQLGIMSTAGFQLEETIENMDDNLTDGPEPAMPETDMASLLQQEASHPDENLSGSQIGRHKLSLHLPSAASTAVGIAESVAGAAESLINMEVDISKPEVVVHTKEAGSGYKKGSPLFSKQQDVIAKQRVSTTMKCIIGLTAQFFAVYTVLFITHSINRLYPTALPRLEKCLMSVAKTLYFIPMLCVLFLATRMRAVQLSLGMTDQHELPQFWVKWAMITCSMAVSLQTIIAAMYYAIFNKDPESARGGTPSTGETVLNCARYLVIGCLYLGFVIVCFGVWLMPAPPEIWGAGGGPPVSPAAICTMFLASLYFVVHFCIGLAETLDEFLTPEGKRFGILAPQTLILRDAAMTVDVAPMLCVLFLSARLRALQLDPREGNPQWWAQGFFYISSFSVLGLLILCLAAAVLLQKEGFFNAGQMEIKPSMKIRAAEVLRSVFMFFLYTGAIVVIISMFMQTRESGPTPSIPPSMKCVMVLTTAYFFVYFALWVTTTMKKLSMPVATAAFVMNLSDFLEKFAKDVIDVCPMLCVLFLGTFLRALQITGNLGAPQPWAQAFMYIGTTSVVLMTLSRIDLLLFKPMPESAQGTDPKPPSRSMMPVFLVLQHVCLFLMHVSVIVVITALLTMTPENARGAGSILSVSAA